MNQASILICTIAALVIALAALWKQESNRDRPFYLKIEVQYGR
ncbi:hypothetical protein PQG02_06835 [Nostoc sp. UHCC 0926]|nr:hypothetical protein [Nostoc sp. UHCC 0926]WDD34056.1 hypothetical protein PQG02_06835 [Nostoc sp. UHCC 0926]